MDACKVIRDVDSITSDEHVDGEMSRVKCAGGLFDSSSYRSDIRNTPMRCLCMAFLRAFTRIFCDALRNRGISPISYGAMHPTGGIFCYY